MSRGAKLAFVASVIAVVAAVAYYVITSHELLSAPSGRTVPGLVLGVLGTLAMLGAALYSWRRRRISWWSKSIETKAADRAALLSRERKALSELQALQRTLLRNPNADRKVIAKEAAAILKANKVSRTIVARVAPGAGAVQLVIERREWGGRLRTWYLWHLALGTVSVVLILLHAGFRFGNVVATLAFVCLLGVVITGFIGLYFYWIVPRRLTIIEERAERTPEELREELTEVKTALAALIANKSKAFLEVYNTETSIPGIDMAPSLRWLFQNATINRDTARPDRLRLIVKEIPPPEQEDFRKAVRLIFRKEKIEVSLYPQLRYDYLLKVWLSAHIPLSAGMWAFSTIHIISVLYY
jgi:hypothetical protein